MSSQMRLESYFCLNKSSLPSFAHRKQLLTQRYFQTRKEITSSTHPTLKSQTNTSSWTFSYDNLGCRLCENKFDALLLLSFRFQMPSLQQIHITRWYRMPYCHVPNKTEIVIQWWVEDSAQGSVMSLKFMIHFAEDVLNDPKGECVICLDDLNAGDIIARLPCLCVYHKGWERESQTAASQLLISFPRFRCIDKWFEVNRSCPEHPSD